MSQLFRLRKNQKGQLLLILGVLEYGWLLYGKITINSAVREGARASTVVKADLIQTTAATAVNKTLGISDGGAINGPFKNRSINASLVDSNKNVEVNVSTKMDALIGIYVADKVEMSAKAYMRWEGGNYK